MKNNPTPVTWASEREQVHQQRRRLIIHTAARIFADKGYEKASIDDVADALQVSKPTIYYYLKSKENLLVEIVMLGIEQVDEALAAQPVGSGLERVEAFTKAYVDSLMDDLGRCMFRNASSWRGSEAVTRVRAAQRGLHQQLLSAVQQGVEDGSIRTQDPKLLTMVIFGALHTLPLWYRTGGPMDLEQIRQGVMDIVLDGVRGDPPQGAGSRAIAARRVRAKPRDDARRETARRKRTTK